MVNRALIQKKMAVMSAREKVDYKNSIIDQYCSDDKPTDIKAEQACDRASKGFYLGTAGILFGTVCSIALGACDAGLGVELGMFAGCALASSAYSSYTGLKAVQAVKEANEYNDDLARKFDIACEVIEGDQEAYQASLADNSMCR